MKKIKNKPKVAKTKKETPPKIAVLETGHNKELKEVSLIDALKKINSDNQNPKEVMFKKFSEYLFSRDKIRLVSDLTDGLILELIRSYIVLNVYQKFWTKRRVEINFTTIKEHPYYIKEVLYFEPDGALDDSFEETLFIIMELLISKNGRGRQDILNALSSTKEELSMMDKAKQLMAPGIN